MKPDNLNTINRSFQIQASNFESKSSNFTKASFLDYTISCVKADSTDTFLEIASGTCVCGRSCAKCRLLGRNGSNAGGRSA